MSNLDKAKDIADFLGLESIEELGAVMNAAIKVARPSIPKKDPWEGLTVKEIVDKFTLKQGRAKAKGLGLKRYSKLSEPELAKLIFNHLSA